MQKRGLRLRNLGTKTNIIIGRDLIFSQSKGNIILNDVLLLIMNSLKDWITKENERNLE